MAQPDGRANPPNDVFSLFLRSTLQHLARALGTLGPFLSQGCVIMTRQRRDLRIAQAGPTCGPPTRELGPIRHFQLRPTLSPHDRLTRNFPPAPRQSRWYQTRIVPLIPRMSRPEGDGGPQAAETRWFALIMVRPSPQTCHPSIPKRLALRLALTGSMALSHEGSIGVTSQVRAPSRRQPPPAFHTLPLLDPVWIP